MPLQRVEPNVQLTRGPPDTDYSNCGVMLETLRGKIRLLEMPDAEVASLKLPDVSDAKRVEWIIHTFSVVRNGKQAIQIAMPCYDGRGNRMVFRCESNQRKQRATMLKYSRSLLKSGLVQAVRGNAFLCTNKTTVFPAAAVTFGTLSDAFFYSHLVDPCYHR